MLNWIDGQPWSNGRVALWGASYEATSAFFTSLLRHPTVVRQPPSSKRGSLTVKLSRVRHCVLGRKGSRDFVLHACMPRSMVLLECWGEGSKALQSEEAK